MRIAFPITQNEGPEGLLAEHFGRAPKFVIYETEGKEFHLIDNTGDHFGGKVPVPVVLKENKADILICKGLGRKAINLFAEMGIDIYISSHQFVKEALAAYDKGELTLASEKDGCAGRHKH